MLSVLLLSVILLPSLCQAQLTVGVNVGDWFVYEGSLIEYEADEGVPFPPTPIASWLVPFNGTDWFRFTVTNVSGTTITFDTLHHWKNGTETTGTYVEDIVTTTIHHAIGANMEVGDQIQAPNIFSTGYIIDETLDWEYGNMTRETNHARLNMNMTGIVLNVDTWWDKASGIQVKVIDNSSMTSAQGNATWVSTAELVDTGVWVIPESYTWTVMLLMVTASTVSLVLYKRKRLYIRT